MAYYNAPKMQSGATDIRNELKNYTSAKQEIDTIVSTLRNNWDDDNNTTYANKYNSDAKVSAENVEKLMNEFADLLESAAQGYEKVYRITAQGMQ